MKYKYIIGLLLCSVLFTACGSNIFSGYDSESRARRIYESGLVDDREEARSAEIAGRRLHEPRRINND